MENQNQPTSNQSTQAQIPLHKRHFKSFWPIVVIALVSALAGGSLVWLLFNQGLEDELNSLIPGKMLVHKNKATDNKSLNFSEVKDWQTYINKEYGFSFEYPNNIKVNQNYNSTKQISLNVAGSSAEFDAIINVWENNKNLDAASVWRLNNIQSQEDVLNKSKLNSDNEVWTISKYGYYFVLILGNKKVVEIEKYTPSSKLTDEYLNQILSTFKFTDQQNAGSQADSKTYTDEEYGFSFDYPANSFTKPEINTTSEGLAVRIQNYNSEDDMYGLNEGQYYLEVFGNSDKNQTNQNNCTSDWEKVESTKIISGTKVFFGYPNQGGDAGGIRYALCTKQNNKNIYIQVTENSDNLSIAKQILSTFKFTTP